MAMRTTKRDLEILCDHINRVSKLENNPEQQYSIGYAYGRPRLYRRMESVEVSPRLPKPDLERWLSAYHAGICVGLAAARKEG